MSALPEVDVVFTQDLDTTLPSPPTSPQLSPLSQARRWTWSVEFPVLDNDTRVKPDEYQVALISGEMRAAPCCDICNTLISRGIRDVWALVHKEWELTEMPADCCECNACLKYAESTKSRTCWCGRCALRRMDLRGILLKQENFCAHVCKPYHIYLGEIFRFSEKRHDTPTSVSAS